MLTLQNADKALKDYYLDAVSAQLNDNISPFFSAIEKNTAYVYGKDVKLSVVRGNSGSILAGSEDGNLPDPYKNRYLDICVPLKNLYGRIEISDKALRASRDASGAFVNLLNSEVEGLVASAKQNFQRMLFGNGSGSMCKITKTVDDYTFNVDKVHNYFVGMVVDIVPANTPVMNDSYGVVISAVDLAAKTITLDRLVDEPLAGGYVYPCNSKGNELTGLGAIFDDTKLYGYTKADEPYFKPYSATATTTGMVESDLTDVIDHMEEEFNSHINMIICSFKARKKIAALISGNRRIMNSIDANTGLGAVTVNGIPVYADKYCPEDRILFLNTDDFCLAQLCDWEWLEDDSGKILTQIPGKPAFGATLVKYAELICKKPCGQAMLKI